MDVLNRVIRQAGAVGACLTALLAISPIDSASATPGDGQVAASCVFTLSAPFVVEVSGHPLVSATLTSLPCTGNMLPNEQTVCVELQGSGSAPQCASTAAYTPAQVFYAPYHAGATYISTGTGCGSIAPTNVSACTTKGPTAKML